MRQKWIWWVLPLVLLGAIVLWQMGDDDASRPAPESQAEHEDEAPDARPAPLLDVTGLEGHASTGRATRDEETDSLATGSTRFHGGVVDEEQSPVAGARVEIRWGASFLRGVTTNAEGAYEFALGAAPLPETGVALAVARSDDGRVGWAVFSTTKQPGSRSGSDIEIRKLILKPAHDAAVHVASDCPGGLPAKLWLRSAAPLRAGVLLTAQTEASGIAVLSGVPEGQWVVYAASQGCGRAWALFATPRPTADPVTLTLPSAHTLTVKILERGTDKPIADATVEVQEQIRLPSHRTRGPLTTAPSEYRTDAAGVVRLTGLGGTETLELYATAAGYPEGSEHSRRRGGAPGNARTTPGQAEVTIHLSPPVTIRWPLEDKGIGIPADGTRVRLKPFTNSGRLTVPPGGVIENGEVVVTGWSTDGASAYAVIDDFGMARLQAQPSETVGFKTAFYPLRRISVHARYEDGSPVVGWWLSVRDGGNNPVARDVPTDGEGRAVMRELFSGPFSHVDVSLRESTRHEGFVTILGAVQLGGQDGQFEVTVPRERTVRIQLVVAHGDLPAGLRAVVRIDHTSTKPAEESGDPALLIVKARAHHADQPTHIAILAKGFVTKPQQVVLADLPDPIELTFELEGTGTAHVRILEPEDKRHLVSLQRLDEASGVWKLARAYGNPSVTVDRLPFEGGIQRFPFMVPGRYRAAEFHSRLVSAAFDIRPGETTQVTLDASKCGFVRGTVEIPQGASYAGLSVGPEQPALSPAQRHGSRRALATPICSVDPEDGSFAYRVSGMEDVQLRVHHRTMRPHPRNGYVTVREPREGVRLVAAQGAIATVRLAKPAVVRVNPGQPRPVPVRLYKGAVDGTGTVLTGTLDASNSTVTFGGYEAGTWTLWIDIPGRAPVVLEDKTLLATDTDLGTAEVSDGSTLRIDIESKEGGSKPYLYLSVFHVDEPKYSRGLQGNAAGMPLTGIGPGRFLVVATPRSGGAKPLREEIEFDGRTEVVRTLEAR